MNKDVQHSSQTLTDGRGQRLEFPVPLSRQHWAEDTVPLVSICCITYNHESFIRECFDGFMMQETTFPVEILIHDDASTDKTADIIREYEVLYPQIIKPIYQVTNQHSLGIRPNRRFNFPRVKGKYVALCEGDDYWIDTMKLRKQVEFLDKNEDYVLCFHKVKIKNLNGDIVDDFITRVPPNHETILDLARKGNYIHTPTVLFRSVTADYPSEFSESKIGDFMLYMYLSQFGKVKYLEEIMAVYRYGVGVWSSRDQYFRRYNTALSHAILFEHFRVNQNSEIASVFANRILNFLATYSETMPNEDFEKLLKYPALGRNIMEQIISDLNRLKPQLIENANEKTLFWEFLKRIKKRIVK